MKGCRTGSPDAQLAHRPHDPCDREKPSPLGPCPLKLLQLSAIKPLPERSVSISSCCQSNFSIGPLKKHSTRSWPHTRAYKTSRVKASLVTMPQELSVDPLLTPLPSSISPDPGERVGTIISSSVLGTLLDHNGVLIRISRHNSL